MRELQAEVRQAAPSAAETPEAQGGRLVRVGPEVSALVAPSLVRVEPGVPPQEGLVAPLVPAGRMGLVELLAAPTLVARVAKGARPALLLAKVASVRCTLCATQVTIRWPWGLDETSSFPPGTAQRNASAIL